MSVGKSAVSCDYPLSSPVPCEHFPFPSCFGCACLEFLVGGLKLVHSALLWVVRESLVLFLHSLTLSPNSPMTIDWNNRRLTPLLDSCLHLPYRKTRNYQDYQEFLPGFGSLDPSIGDQILG